MDAILTDELMKQLADNSYLFAGNAAFVEEMYGRFLADPASVSEDWRRVFEKVRRSNPAAPPDADHETIRASFGRLMRQGAPAREAAPAPASAHEAKQVAVLQLINAYRFRGHQCAETDPIRLRPQEPLPELDLAYHKLTEADLDTLFNTGSLVGPDQAPLRDIVQAIKDIYCGHVGSEYMHINNTAEKRWIQNRLERPRARAELPAQRRREILEQLIAAEGLEKYLHVKYVGQKRFSLEGAESLIPLLSELISRAGDHSIKEVVLGMAHRGRINVLVNILGKSPRLLFREFEGKFDAKTNQGSGDVKYHQGFACDVSGANGAIHVTLAFNPSHLEIVDPVVQGSVRARQHRWHDLNGGMVLPVLIHGDSAFAGQGVVMETLQMSQARGYTTGGTVHVVVNNQIGFTTSHPRDVRSSFYCTEVAKIVQAPIFHVNGDDPEAVLFITQLALDYRMEFRKDVVIDMVCYRRHGHNEADEPKVTQPMMYRKIAARPTITQLYGDQLVKDGVVQADELEVTRQRYRKALDDGMTVAAHVIPTEKPAATDWTPYKNTHWTQPAVTRVSAERIQALVHKACETPDGFTPHPSVARILDARRRMAGGEAPCDWGFAEIAAYATLLQDGYAVRLSGQDSGRGTFFHRHAVLHDQNTGDSHIPLQHLQAEQPGFVVIDSLLSEEAVLGFEYGYASSDPRSLVIWEAQFGDFANGAQVVVDQFIVSGEAKWGRLAGIVLFLPHGYDGQGPEHSSARLERYLLLCAEDNNQVVVPSTPAQMFHMLRRQMIRPLRKPLIVMTPKSLLRHKLATSPLEEFTNGEFQAVIGEHAPMDPKKVRHAIVCGGKLYFELLQARNERGIENLPIVRIEQLYPFPQEALLAELEKYPKLEVLKWSQEEPANKGAGPYIRAILQECIAGKQRLTYASRPAAAAPAVGYLQRHLEQQLALIDETLKFDS
jgi:2-oxoglutarate dehydrogenase E1 component